MVQAQAPHRHRHRHRETDGQTDGRVHKRPSEGHNMTTVYYPGLPWSAETKTLRNTNPIHHLHCPQIPHIHSQPSLPGLPFYLVYGLILGRTQRTPVKETQRTRGQTALPLYSPNSGFDG